MRTLRPAIAPALLLALVAAPAAAQDTIQVREPQTITFVPDPPVVVEVDTVAADTVRHYLCRTSREQRERTWFQWGPWQVVDEGEFAPCPPGQIPAPPDPVLPDDPATDLPLIFSTDFENGASVEAFFELSGFSRRDGELVATIPAGQQEGGSAKLGIGAVPDPYFDPVGNEAVAYTSLRWCADLRIEGARGVPYKVARVASFASSDWSEAAVAHLWGEPNAPYLTSDPVSSVVGSQVRASGYNDFDAFRWLGAGSTSTNVVDGWPHRVCALQVMNTIGQADGSFSVWVDGDLELEQLGLDWRGSYRGYGWNGLFLEAYYNGGPPADVTIAFDNLEVRGAGTRFSSPGPDPDPDPDPDPSPGDVWFEQEWDFPSVAAMLAEPHLGPAQNVGGALEIVSGLTGTPTGFTHAVRARFDANQGREPEVGVNVTFPRATTDRPRELWLEYYARFSPNWEVDGPGAGSAGHKHLFLFDQRQTGANGGRWESYVGLFGEIMSQEISGETAPGTVRVPYSPSVRALWNGEWHLFRYHARMHPTDGRWDMWVNGQLFTWGRGDTDFGANLHFLHLALSRNLNKGTDRTMWLDFGPVRVYTSDPGWR